MKPGKSVEVPSSACLDCGYVCELAREVGGSGEPTPGSISICFACGHLMAFDDKLRFRELTDEEMHEVAGDSRIIAFQKARALARKPP